MTDENDVISSWNFFVRIWQSSCLLNFGTDMTPYFSGVPTFRFQPSKKHQAKRKSINQTLFSTKSTMLNPMVQSHLVTYRGVTVLVLFLHATIDKTIAKNNFQFCFLSVNWAGTIKFTSVYYFQFREKKSSLVLFAMNRIWLRTKYFCTIDQLQILISH